MSNASTPFGSGASGVDAEGVFAVFYERAVEDKHQSTIEGRPIFKPVPYVQIIVPGNTKSTPNERVNDSHKQRWPEAWKKFEAREEGMANGTPLQQWPRLTRVRVAELQASKIYTVEQLASMADTALARIGPDARDLRKEAERFLNSGPSEVEKELRTENAELKQRLRALEARMDAKTRYHGDSDAEQEDDEAKGQGEREVVRQKPGPKPKPKEIA